MVIFRKIYAAWKNPLLVVGGCVFQPHVIIKKEKVDLNVITRKIMACVRARVLYSSKRPASLITQATSFFFIKALSVRWDHCRTKLVGVQGEGMGVRVTLVLEDMDFARVIRSEPKG